MSETPPAGAAVGAVCPRCRSALEGQPGYARYAVCDVCREHFTLSAGRRIELLVDQGSFRETHQNLTTDDPLGFSDRLPYQERLVEARERTGAEESVITGIGQINGRSAVLAVSEFGFRGASMVT